MRVIGHMQDVCALSKRQVVQEAGLEAPQHRLLPYRRKPKGGQCLQRNCCQDHPKVTQQKVSPWIGFYWPRMGSSLTSGGRLRRNTPCCVCHTCSTRFSWWSIHCHDKASIWSSLWRYKVLTHWLGDCAAACTANHARQRFHCCWIQCECGPL